MPVIDFIEHARQLAAEALVDPNAEDAGDGIGREPKEAHLTGPLEDLVDREVAPEDEISAVFHLIQ
jgi:hypothetical protein